MDRITEEYIRGAVSVLTRGNESSRRALVKAGKELALLIVWMQNKGANLQGNLQGRIEALLKSAPDAKKEVVAFYRALQDVPAITSALFKGFNMMICEGELQIHFNWKNIDTATVQEVAQELRGAGKE